MPVADLPDRDPAGWARATEHPFLAAIREGSVPEAAFDVWLAQDYRFVTDLLGFQARLLARVSRAAQPVLAGGLVALVDELAWFERCADARGLDLAVRPLPATVGYGGLLQRLDAADVAVALAMLWAVERVYLDAWSHATPGAPAYREFVEHWTAPEFGTYVTALAAAADDTLRRAGEPPALDQWFADVIAAETEFWDMAWTGGRR
jgi:thiaminase